MQEIIEKIKEHLQRSHYNTIVIEKGDFRKQRKNVSKKKSYFSFADILNESGSIEAFFQKLPHEGFDGSKIYLKSPNGTSTRTVDILFFNQQNSMIPNRQRSSQDFNNLIQPTNYQTNYPMAMMATPQVVNSSSSDRIEFLRDKCQEYKGKVQQLENLVQDLKNENFDLKLKNTIVEEKARLEVIEAKLENKGFFESDTGKKIVDYIPLLMKKQGESIPQAMGNPYGNISETKTQFIEFVSNPKIDDEVVETAYFVIKYSYEVQGFKGTIQKLLEENTHKNAS